jgi:hypothetical protein
MSSATTRPANLADLFPGMGEQLAEWIVTSRDGQELTVQLAYFHRTRDPLGVRRLEGHRSHHA